MDDRPPSLVWLAEVPWRGLPQRHHRLVEALRREWAVLFVEPPPPLAAPRPRVVTTDGVRVVQVAPLVNARPAALRRLLAVPAVRRLAARLAALQLLAAARPADAPVVVCSNVFLGQAAAVLRPRKLVVDLADDPRYFPGAPAWTPELLTGTIGSADLVTTPSRFLAAELGRLGARRVRYLSNGAPAALLETPPRPEAGLVGYLGTIGEWFDFDLVDRLAAALPDAAIALAGPIDPAVATRADALRRHPNLRLLGPVHGPAVAETLARFAVGVIPFRRTALTRSVNPNKLYEYAALDLPIVATPFSADVTAFAPPVDAPDTPDAFVAAVRERLAGVGRLGTRSIAAAHTWEALGAEFARLVRSL